MSASPMTRIATAVRTAERAQGVSVNKGVEPPPQFSAHFYCGQTAGCIKMPLGMEVGLSPRDFVLDGDLDPLPKKEEEPPIFGPCLL